MNFDLTEEQQMLQETVGQLLANECPVTRLREVFDSDTGFDESLWKGLGELGILGLNVPEDFGGAGLETLDLAVVAETMGYHAAPGPFLGHALAIEAIVSGGSEAQKKKWLPDLASGARIGAVAIADSDGGWASGHWKIEPGDQVSGTQSFATGGQHADLFVVGLAGGRLGVVDAEAAGFSRQSVDGADLTRRLVALEFDRTPCELLADDDAQAARRLHDVGCVLLAADAFGGSVRLLEMSVEYAKTREQFGVKIGHFQALKHQLASMALDVEPGRGLYWYAAYAQDHVADESERIAAVAKAHMTDRYMDVARNAVEAHGGIGFTWECDVQIWFKRAMFNRAFLGHPGEHRRRQAEMAGW
ncbi:MAG: acyl-CoA/acyl-ACP dehydrogenase [Myxococcota bacterium]|nr:acyl-CoA/acyl-ACP dehydrogenase [Myxococcota bacterium]